MIARSLDFIISTQKCLLVGAKHKGLGYEAHRLQEHWTRIMFNLCSGKCGVECPLLLVNVRKYSVLFQRVSLDTEF